MPRYITNIALAAVPVNSLPLLDDTDFKTRETAVAYNASGMDLVWNFVSAAGVFSQTAVTPTTGGSYDWTHQGDGIYTIEIPKSGGASINNTTTGIGWFSGVATGVLPWTGPMCEFVFGGEITSGTPTTTSFVCAELAAANTDHYKDIWIKWLSGNCKDAICQITAFNAGTDTVTCSALPTAPAVGDKFEALL